MNYTRKEVVEELARRREAEKRSHQQLLEHMTEEELLALLREMGEVSQP